VILFDKNNKNDVSEASNEAGTASLGSIAKSSTTYTQKTTVVHTGEKVREARQKRYALATAIRKIYVEEGKRRGLLIPTTIHRQSLCKWAMTGDFVQLMRDEATAKAFFAGVQTCGSVWCCPVCANRIQEVRRQEIALAMKHFIAKAKAKGVEGKFKQAVMVTFTFPHTRDDSLKELLVKQSEALKKLRAGNVWTLFKNRIGFEGLVRSLEVTRGGNGWHPHTHELWFCDYYQDEEKFKEFLVNRWLSVCQKVGLVGDELNQVEAFLLHSVDVRFHCDTSDYLAKMDDKSHWGVDREIAKASTKLGKAKGMHPFELAYKGYSSLWLEYSEAIKGKSQLYWSQGLKARVGIEDKSDEDISKEQENEPLLVGELEKDEWFKVLSKELRAYVLDWIEDGQTIKDIKLLISLHKW
jgi:pyrimidine deaminase RibD-like protein